jgi:hypothetical protein
MQMRERINFRNKENKVVTIRCTDGIAGLFRKSGCCNRAGGAIVSVLND